MYDFSTEPVTINWGNFVDKKVNLNKVDEKQVTSDTVSIIVILLLVLTMFMRIIQIQTYNPMGEAVYAY